MGGGGGQGDSVRMEKHIWKLPYFLGLGSRIKGA